MDPALRQLLEGVTTEELEVIIKLRDPQAVPPHVRLVARFGQVMTGRVERQWIREVWGHPDVISFKAPRLLEAEPEILDLEAAGDVAWRDTDLRRPSGLEVTGRGVVIGLVDVGCDFAHPHFRHADGSSRLLALWDQSKVPSPVTVVPYGYGAVYTRDDINRALAQPQPYQALGYHPAQADPQGIGAHGTLVLDIAAGNGRTPGSPQGIAPEADLIFVHASTGVMGGLANLGDSVRILEALDFIARTARGRPWVVNISMGRRGGCHDGLSLVEQGLDELLVRTPGAALSLSTGNYFTAQAHASGQLRPAQQRTLIWQTDRADITPNELEIWYSGKDVITLEVEAPSGGPRFRIALAEDGPVLIDGRKVGHIYHRARDPNNGDNQINIFLRPEAPAGAWQVNLIGEDIVDGRFHAWVERDAPCPHCDSRFDPRDADPYCTTGTLCNGFRTVAVGAYDAHSPDLGIAAFSSCGPLRDFRQKPDLVAPGREILGARSAPRGDERQDTWLTRMSGTSFAAPHVTGAIALMFEAAGRPLTIQETRRLLLGSTRSGQGSKTEPVRLGSGYLDIAQAVAAAYRFKERGPTRFPETKLGSENLRAALLASSPRAGLITMESTMTREDEDWHEDAPKTPPTALSFKFNSKIIRKYKDENGDNRLTNCTVVVPIAARNKKEIDLLVFFHGLDTCDPGHNFDANKVVKIFGLDTQVEDSKGEGAIAAPALYWVKLKTDGSNQKEVDENKEDIKKAWSAAQLNAFVEEVLDKIGENSSDRPSLRRLILAGHSRAYDLLTPLANEFVSSGADTTKGALAKLAKVLAMDTTYGENHAKILKKWADKLGGVKFLLVLGVPKGYEPLKDDCKYKKHDPPIKYWDCAMQGVKLPANLEVKKVSEEHCQLPNKYVKTALGAPMPVLHLEEQAGSGEELPEWSPADEEPTEKTPERHVILISGGPGLFDEKDIEMGISGGFGAWEKFILPPYFKASNEYGEFPADETYWWFVYRPAYTAKWKQDLNKLSINDQEKVKNRQIKSYVETIAAKYFPNRINNWNLVWLDDADSFWRKLETFKKGSIAQVCYWGYASGADLWLSGGFKPDFPPEEFEIIKGGDIKRARYKDRFLPADKKRPHRFVGGDTYVFAQEWARVFNVWTEGTVGKVNFVSIAENENEPCLIGNAQVKVYSPGAKDESTNTARLPKCPEPLKKPVAPKGKTVEGEEGFGEEVEEWRGWSAEEEEPTEKTTERNLILVSGGPGLYEEKDIWDYLKQSGWQIFYQPPHLKAYGPEFPEKDEKVWWIIYRPAYAFRWKADLINTKVQDEYKTLGREFLPYINTLETVASSLRWNLVWIDDADGFWRTLASFKKGSISRVYYWGYANNDLWLSPNVKPDLPPADHEIIKVAKIDPKLKDRFLPGDRTRPHRFVGNDTDNFARTWARAFGVWTEGVEGKVNFKIVFDENTGNEPCRIGNAQVKLYSPGVKETFTNQARMPQCPEAPKPKPWWEAEEDDFLEAEKKRNFVIISGGPGTYDPKDPEHDKAWSSYVDSVLLKSKDSSSGKIKQFWGSDEEVHWLIYKPAYEDRWTDDVNESRTVIGQVKKTKCDSKDCTSYVDLLTWRAKQRGWTLHWLSEGDDIWDILAGFKKGSISRLWYYGHASYDLWLALRHDDHTPVAPISDAIFKLSDISTNKKLKDRFEKAPSSYDSERIHLFHGCNTDSFAKEWSDVFHVWTEGAAGTIQFGGVHRRGDYEPEPTASCVLNRYKPGGIKVTPSTEGVEVFLEGLEPEEAFLRSALYGEELGEWLNEEVANLGERGSGEDEPPAQNLPALLVQLADEALARNQAISTSALVAEALSQAGIGLEDIDSENGPLPSADTIFQALTGPGSSLRSRLESFFEVMAVPKETLGQDLQPGGLLVRLAPGEPGLGHISVIAGPELISREVLGARGITPEGHRPGYYAVVIEGGSHPHRLDDNFARLVVGTDNRVPPNQMLLRVRPDMVMLMPGSAELVEGGGVDTSASVPDFAAAVRSEVKTPLLGPDQNKAAIKWNNEQHPAQSGLDPADIRTELGRYVDLKAVEQELKAYNKANPKNPIAMGAPPVDAVVAEALHQFQVKSFVEAGQRDGKAGESTLDSLGLVERSGLNTVDVANTRAQDRLNKKAAQISKDTAGEFTAANWFQHMVNPSFLGQRVKNGIHLVLLRQLRLAEKYLLSLPAYKDMTPVELGAWMKITEMHRGARPTAKTASMHTFGLAVDINYEGNPWVAGQHLDRDKDGKLTAKGKTTQQANREFTEAIKHASLLTAGVDVDFTPTFLSGLSKKKTEDIFIELKNRDDNLRTYLGMEGDPKRIKQYLQKRQTEGTPGVFLSSETIDQAVIRWQGLIDQDLANLRKKTSNFETRDPKKGFLNLESPLVIALRDVAGLAWGAVDFGDGESGDMMHFDARRSGVGLTLVKS